MTHFSKSIRGLACAVLATVALGNTAFAYVPDKLFGAMYTDYGDIFPTTINHPFTESITPFPSTYIIDESNINGVSPPSGQPGGAFERNEHVARFATASEGNQGHFFQRREAWDIAFDMKIETPNISPRKEAGLYFKSSAGNALFIATSNDTHYGTGQGEITTIFGNVIPGFSFSGGGGPLGDYNQNGLLDAPDYVVWRDTLGSTTDFRANGNNEGASMDLIDQADYEVWRSGFGNGAPTDLAHYNVGDTLRMRLIYTPPVLSDPLLPDVINDPNVVTPATMEYIISLNGSTPFSSGPKEFDNAWKGLPKDTQIMLRVQNMGTAAVDNDSSKVTFSNFDLNGNLPGSGLGSGAALGGTVPEPTGLSLLGIAILAGLARSRRRAAL